MKKTCGSLIVAMGPKKWQNIHLKTRYGLMKPASFLIYRYCVFK